MDSRPLVIIEWEDSAQPIASWAFLEDLEIGGVVRCASVGWLVHDDDRVKALAPNMGGLEDGGSAQVSGVIRIPTRCVINITPLTEITSPSSRPAKGRKRRGS